MLSPGQDCDCGVMRVLIPIGSAGTVTEAFLLLSQPFTVPVRLVHPVQMLPVYAAGL